MSKMTEIVKRIVQDGNKVRLVLPGIGVSMGTVERIDDDVITIKPDGEPRMVIHIAQFSVQRD